MKVTVHFPISKNTKVLVDDGDKIDSNTPLAEEPLALREETILVAKILRVNPSAIYKYLKKQVGQEINKGEILAEKRGFFSSCVIKSPISAKLGQIDLKKGTLTLLKNSPSRVKKITCPIPGKVKSINRSYIEVEIDGELYEVYRGEGKDVFGRLYYFSGETLGVLDISFATDNCIIACQSVAEEGLVKLEVLGAAGLILRKAPKETEISWVQVSEEVLKKLSLFASKNIWLRPEEKQIIVEQ